MLSDPPVIQEVLVELKCTTCGEKYMVKAANEFKGFRFMTASCDKCRGKSEWKEAK